MMAEMLESFPQVSFDLGPPTMTEAELEAWLASDDLNAAWQPEDYNVRLTASKSSNPARRHRVPRNLGLRQELQPFRQGPLREDLAKWTRRRPHAAGPRRHRGDALRASGVAPHPRSLSHEPARGPTSNTMSELARLFLTHTAPRPSRRVTRLVVVSWGRATRKKKKELAAQAEEQAAAAAKQ